MRRADRLRSYLVAVGVTVLALGLNLALAPLLAQNTFPAFLAAVMAATWSGGLGPGLAAAGLSGLLNLYFFLPPEGSLAITSASTAARLVLYLLSALFIAAVGAALRRGRDRARAAAHEARLHREALAQSETRLRTLLESATGHAIFMLDPGGRVVSWNPGAERILGWVEAEVGGRSHEVFHPPDDRQSGRPAKLLELAASLGRVAEQGWRVRRDGSRFWADVVVNAAWDTAGGLRGYSVVVQDISERRQAEATLRESEERFRTALELAPDGIVIADRDGRIVLANTQAHRMFGYEPDELPGQPVEVLVPERLRQGHRGHRDTYQASPRTRPMGQGLSLWGQRKDGSEIPVEISLSPLRTAQGLLVTSVIRDITERRQTEERIEALNADLQRRVAELAAVNRELEAFSYSVSHDLRAPLRAIDGFSQALLEDCADRLDEEGRDHLRRVRAGAQRMAALIDDLLDLARVTRREMRREPVDLSAMAHLVVAQLRRTEPDRRVEVVIAEGLKAEGDPHLLRLALDNLLGNAWKFTGRRPRARIEVGRTEQPDGRTVYFVADNGVGFDMAHAGKLFGAFQRLHGVAEFPGTGIGLATVQRVIHRHGGEVWAEARAGEGATFCFTLPGADREAGRTR